MIRIYSDTSVISCIDAPDTPEREDATVRLFKTIANNPSEYELVVSTIAIQELQQTPEPRRKRLRDFLESQKYTLLPKFDEADDLAEHYVKEGVLSDKHEDGLLHIAYSVVADCDYIVSWNMKHFVNIKTITRVNAVNAKLGYQKVSVVTPQLFIGDTDEKS